MTHYIIQRLQFYCNKPKVEVVCLSPVEIPPLTPPKRGRTIPPFLGEARWGTKPG